MMSDCKLAARIKELEAALRGCLSAMELQEKRDVGMLHLTVAAAWDIWDRARVAGKAALSAPASPATCIVSGCGYKEQDHIDNPLIKHRFNPPPRYDDVFREGVATMNRDLAPPAKSPTSPACKSATEQLGELLEVAGARAYLHRPGCDMKGGDCSMKCAPPAEVQPQYSAEQIERMQRYNDEEATFNAESHSEQCINENMSRADLADPIRCICAARVQEFEGALHEIVARRGCSCPGQCPTCIARDALRGDQ